MVPVSVMLPSVAVTFRLPATLEAASVTPVVLTMVALAPTPLVLTVNEPVTAWLSTVMVLLAVEVV